MTAPLLTRAEVSALNDAGEQWSARRGDICALVTTSRGEAIAAIDGDDGVAVDDARAQLMAAAPALRATALDAMDRADAAEQECARLRAENAQLERVVNAIDGGAK